MGADLGANTSRTNATRKWGLITGYNYTNTSDGSKNPINVQIPGVTFAAIGRSIVNLFCKTGLCPSGTTSDVTLGPFTQINYEYS
jgi:hypothetical protein